MSKVFISVLGTTDYVECVYIQQDSAQTCKTRFVQEATVLMNCANWSSKDRIIIFTTKDAENRNWLDGGQLSAEMANLELQSGLKSRLEALSLKPSVNNITIPEGKSIDEIWAIFNLIFAEFKKSDEVIFDITHSFRSIPMLVMVILNYAKVVCDVSLKGIYYGSMESLGNLSEVKKMPVEDRIVPILDLSAFDELLDWSIAIERFLESGDGSKVFVLADRKSRAVKRIKQGPDKAADTMKTIAACIRAFSENMSTCRGLQIPSSITDVKQSVSKGKYTDMDPAFQPLLSHLDERLSNFTGRPVEDGLRAVQWCAEHNLVQQGYTILREFMISYVCKGFGVDEHDWEKRSSIANSIGKDVETWQRYQKQRKGVKVKIDLVTPEYELFSPDSELPEMFSTLFGLRNDINHAGMRKGAKPAKTLKDDLHKLISQMNRLVLKNN